MLKYKLLNETNEKYVYAYYPNGDTDFGVITFFKDSNKAEITNLASTDKFKRHAFKLMFKLKEFNETKKFKKEGLIAWH